MNTSPSDIGANPDPLRPDHAAPLLSIGMPVYNGERYVRDSIDSILRQNCDFELIISDNASTDRTELICRDYAARDSRVRYVRSDANRGAAWNYNQCFHLSQSKYFKWAAYDDALAPDFCAKCLEALERDPGVALAYSRATIIDAEGKPVRVYSDRMDLPDESPSVRFRKHLLAFRGYNICNAVFGVFRAAVLRRTRLIRSFLSSDQILLGEISLNGRVHEIAEPLFYYRWHPKNSMYGYTPAERLVWFDPANKTKLCLLRSTWLRNYADAVVKATMPHRERVKCMGHLLLWAFQNSEVLSRETLKGLLWPILSKTSHRQRPTGW